MTQYVKFIPREKGYLVFNIVYNQIVGVIKKARMGRWMHWQLFSLNKDIGYTNGCLKEISSFITTLYRR